MAHRADIRASASVGVLCLDRLPDVGKGDTGPIARRNVSPPEDADSCRADVELRLARAAWALPAGAAIRVEIECSIEEGSVGFVLRPEREDRFISREVIMEARTGNQRLCLTTEPYESDALLLREAQPPLAPVSIELSRSTASGVVKPTINGARATDQHIGRGLPRRYGAPIEHSRHLDRFGGGRRRRTTTWV